jgi:hypothetical protein
MKLHGVPLLMRVGISSISYFAVYMFVFAVYHYNIQGGDQIVTSKRNRSLAYPCTNIHGLCQLPCQQQTRELWYALNRRSMQKPMVLIDQMPWNELMDD